MLCLSLWPLHYFAFKLTLDAKIQPVILKYRRDRPFLTKVTCWSRSTSDFHLIGQNLTGEFMWKIYAASWNLLTLTAEADRVLCQLFNCLFPLDVQNKIRLLSSLLLFMASLFIVFLFERCVACQSRKSDFGWHRFRFWPCLMRKKVQKSQMILAYSMLLQYPKL